MTVYTNSITKAEIDLLTIEEFPGDVIIVETPKDAELAVEWLSQYTQLGFDTETRPSFKKGQRYVVSLMQIATEDKCFLFRMNKIGIPPGLKKLLRDEKITKVGLSLRDDFGALRKRSATVELNNFVDLQLLVGQYGIEDFSLQKIYAILFKKKISKGKRLSNWEADELSDSQQKYAALDAWACLEIYKELKKEK